MTEGEAHPYRSTEPSLCAAAECAPWCARVVSVICSAVVLPLVEESPGRWLADCVEATPVLVPLLSLGQRVVASAPSEAEGAFSLAAADEA